MKVKNINRIIALILVTTMLVTCFPEIALKVDNVTAATTTYGYVDVTSSLNVRKGAGTTYGLLTDANGRSITLYPNQKVTILSESNGWYRVSFTYNGATYTGYVSGAYVNVYDGTYDSDYAAKLKAAGFPDSYIPALCYLHSQHPNWVFTPYITNLDWATSVAEESKLGRSLIPVSSISSWLSRETGAYNWATDTYVEFDSGGWVAASKELVEFYLDPRNFLSESGIFMFEKLTYNSKNHTEAAVQNILNGTFMSGTYDGKNTYASLFVEAGKKSGVSPFMLAARVKQEQGTAGTSGSISGTYSGYEGYYNYFNIGAWKTSTMSAIERGLWYASQTDTETMRPWNTRYKSIIGGSLILGSQYINKGQNTLYLQKFNVTPTNTYGHQYMTNIQASASEAEHQRSAYSGLLDLPIEFSIPVFKNMTDQPAGRPTAYGNPNSNLKTLTISNGSLTPSFVYSTKTYSAVVESNVTSVTINATAVSLKSTVTGTGTKTLNYGNNIFNVVVTAENGTKTTYKITINRKAAATPTPVPSGTVTPTPSGTVTPTPVITGTPTPTKVPESVTGSVYTVKTGYIVGVAPDTTVEEFFANITVKGSKSKKVVDSTGTVKGNSTVVATGYKLQTDTLTYIICVDGDVDGDGKVNVRDLLYVKKNLLGSQTLNTAQNYAACVSGSSKPTVKDLLMIKKYLMGAISDF